MTSRTLTQPHPDLPSCIGVRDFSRVESLRWRREDQSAVIAREARLLGLAGVYVLWAPRTAQVYVGRADDLARRLTEHGRSKPWWTHVAVSAIEPRGLLAKEQWEWIEAMLIQQVAAQAGWQLENSQRPQIAGHWLHGSLLQQAQEATRTIALQWLLLGLEALHHAAPRGPARDGEVEAPAVLDAPGPPLLPPEAATPAGPPTLRLRADLLAKLPRFDRAAGWTRDQVAAQLGLAGGAALRRGIFTPAGAPWFVLFATAGPPRPDAPPTQYVEHFDFEAGTAIYSLETSELSAPRWARALEAWDPATGAVHEAVLLFWRAQRDDAFTATGWWRVAGWLAPVTPGAPRRVRLERITPLPVADDTAAPALGGQHAPQ